MGRGGEQFTNMLHNQIRMRGTIEDLTSDLYYSSGLFSCPENHWMAPFFHAHSLVIQFPDILVNFLSRGT